MKKLPFRNASEMPRRAKEDDDDEDGLNFGKAFKVALNEVTAKAKTETGEEVDVTVRLANIYVYGPIESSEQFIPAVQVLQGLEGTDHVVVHLSTPGGSVNATDTFLHALDSCPATNTFIATGGCHSAGSMMLMHAEEVVLSEGFHSLVHNGSMGWGGKTSDFRSAAKFYCDWDSKLMRDTYAGFMTPEEIERMIAGEDFWFDREEFMARLQKRNDIDADLE